MRCTVASYNCKVWAETVGRRDDKTVSGHVSKMLSRAAISPKCNDRVLREQRNISDTMALWRKGRDTGSGICVGCAFWMQTSHIYSAPGWDLQLTVGRLLEIFLNMMIQIHTLSGLMLRLCHVARVSRSFHRSHRISTFRSSRLSAGLLTDNVNFDMGHCQQQTSEHNNKSLSRFSSWLLEIPDWKKSCMFLTKRQTCSKVTSKI